jgi:hypothetical protein
MWSGQRWVGGLLAKPTTRQVMARVQFFMYQGYERRKNCKHSCRAPHAQWKKNLAQWLQVHLFFTFFLSPISVSFAEKVNPRWLQLNLFFVAPTCHHTICYAGNPYLSYGAKIILPPRKYPPFHTISTTMSPPPPPRSPVAAETLAILVVRVNYIYSSSSRCCRPTQRGPRECVAVSTEFSTTIYSIESRNLLQKLP